MNEMVVIPFAPEMASAVLAGKKTITSRNKQYGGAGSYFFVASKEDSLSVGLYQIKKIELHELHMVAQVYYSEEGFASPTAFVEAWKLYHPGKPFEHHREVFVHFFEEIFVQRNLKEGVL